MTHVKCFIKILISDARLMSMVIFNSFLATVTRVTQIIVLIINSIMDQFQIVGLFR